MMMLFLALLWCGYCLSLHCRLSGGSVFLICIVSMVLSCCFLIVWTVLCIARVECIIHSLDKYSLILLTLICLSLVCLCLILLHVCCSCMFLVLIISVLSCVMNVLCDSFGLVSSVPAFESGCCVCCFVLWCTYVVCCLLELSMCHVIL